jgi:hypothetical protein
LILPSIFFLHRRDFSFARAAETDQGVGLCCVEKKENGVGWENKTFLLHHTLHTPPSPRIETVADYRQFGTTFESALLNEARRLCWNSRFWARQQFHGVHVVRAAPEYLCWQHWPS